MRNPRPRYKRANRTPAPPLVLPAPLIQPEPDSELARKMEAAMEQSTILVVPQVPGSDVWDTNGRTL